MLERVSRYKELFRYENGKLYRKVDKQKGKAGAEAGTLTNYGYLTVRVDKKMVMVHRIIWEIERGPIPKGFEIDHIDGIRNNNHINNLRIATRSENRWNAAIRKDNTSGVRGVRWHKGTKKWRAEITISGKTKLLGHFATFNDAVNLRRKEEIGLFGIFSPIACR